MSRVVITKLFPVSMVLILLVFSFSASSACDQLKLTASDANTEDRFGVSVAIDGPIAVIGAYNADSNGIGSGAAYVYEFYGADWIELQKLIASDGDAGDKFGISVAIDGGTIVVGSHLDDNIGTDSGSAYVFTRSEGLWSRQQKLIPLDSAAGDKFGFSVAVDNNTIVVGAYGSDSTSGAAYVFTKTGENWSQRQKLTPSDPCLNGYFGYSVEILNNTVIIGSYKDNHSGRTYAGSAYVFTFDGQSWSQNAVLRASDPESAAYFGCSIALNGDSLVIGAYECDINGVSDAGAAYVFDRTETGWIQRQKLFSPNNPGAGADFGRSVGIEGDNIVIGCPNYLINNEQTGAVFEFVRSNDLWIQSSLFTADDANSGDSFGYSTAISGLRLIAGSHFSDGSGQSSGAAYVFTHPACDFDRNCNIDFADFAVLSAFWRQNAPLADIYPLTIGDGIVDFYDLALFCDYWLIDN